jgi:hypothetical protein
MSTVFGQGRLASSEEGPLEPIRLASAAFFFGHCQKAKFKIKKLSELIWRLSIARREGAPKKKKSPDFCTGFPVCIQERIIEG